MYSRDKLRKLLNGNIEHRINEEEKYNFSGMIMTSYFGKLKDIFSEDVIYLVVSRFPPKSLVFNKNIIHMPILSPSEDLLFNTKSGLVDNVSYESLYMIELNKYMKDTLHKIALEIDNGKKICLLCYEKTGDLCHRHLLSRYLNQEYNIGIMEL